MTTLFDTDEADSFLTLRPFPDRAPSDGFFAIPVLEFLVGRPWNNLALNFVYALEATALDVFPWDSAVPTGHLERCVRVFLAGDNRTIKRIEQSVRVGLIGARSIEHLLELMPPALVKRLNP